MASTAEIISMAANLALALSLIVALIFGIAQVNAARRDRRERFTLDALRNFQSREFAELANYINGHDLPKTMDEWQKLSVNDQVMLLQFSQEMESLGILVAEKFVNIDLVDKTIGSLVTIGWDKFKAVILDIRKNHPDPFLNEYFQWLAEKLDARMKLHPRQPFHEINKK
jgi:hypothetical protein